MARAHDAQTRRQLEAYSHRRALEIAHSLWKEGGVVALWSPGLAATVARELVYSGCTKGLYPLARDAISGNAEPTLAQRVAAASATGFGGSICANALDIVKIRQFDQPQRYSSLVGGLRRFWRVADLSLLPQSARNASCWRSGARLGAGLQ